MDTAFRMALLAGALGLSAFGAGTAVAQSNPVKDGVDAWSKADYKKAVKDWRGPAAKGDADAEFNMGQAYKLGRGVPAADLAQAQEWYHKAALQGHFQAEDNYGLLLFQGGHQADAVPWLEKSVARGEPRAELVLGTMLFNGDGGQTKDWPRAYALMTRASNSGLPQASQTLGEMDKYIPEDQRKQGLVLARQYETNAQHTQLPPEVTASTGTPRPPIRTTPVAPSQVARNDHAGPGASYPTPGARPPQAVPPRAIPAPPRQAPPPAPRHVQSPPTPATAPNGHGWRVQLGAFSSDARARSLWESLSPHVASLRGGQPYLVHAGAVTRLQAGAFASSADATRACAEVKRAGNACLPVAP